MFFLNIFEFSFIPDNYTLDKWNIIDYLVRNSINNKKPQWQANIGLEQYPKIILKQSFGRILLHSNISST